MYDVDEILYRPMKYEVPKKVISSQTTSSSSTKGQQQTRLEARRMQATWHMNRVAGAIGKKLVFRSMNFTSTQTFEGDGQTYDSIVSGLFGWSAQVPTKQINVFIRAKDNTLYVIQRGQEMDTIDITDTDHTLPQIDHEITRTLWHGPGDDSAKSDSTSSDDDSSDGGGPHQYAFDGVIDVAGTRLEYQCGLLVHSFTRSPDGGWASTVYNYDCIQTSEARGAVHLLSQSTETGTPNGHYNADGNALYDVTRTVTTYHRSWQCPDWVVTNTYTDGVLTSTNISQQDWDAAPSRYMVDSIYFPGPKKKNQLPPGDNLREDGMFPIVEKDILEQLTGELKWLNRRTKETVTMNVYNYEHVVDFTDKVKFKGHEYFLEQNQIQQDIKSLKQSLTLVRWY